MGLQAARPRRTRLACTTFTPTILHLLGIDHTKLTVRHNGIDRRLTDDAWALDSGYHRLKRMGIDQASGEDLETSLAVMTASHGGFHGAKSVSSITCT